MWFLSVLVCTLLTFVPSLHHVDAQKGDLSNFRVLYECCVVPPQPCNAKACSAWKALDAVKTASAEVAKADKEYTHTERMLQTGVGESRVGLYTSESYKGAPKSLGDFIRANPPPKKKKAMLLLENGAESAAESHSSKSRLRERLEALTETSNPYGKDNLWANGIIYYGVDDRSDHLWPDKVDDEDLKKQENAQKRVAAAQRHRTRIAKAMTEYEANTCVYFDENQGPPPAKKQVKFVIGRMQDSACNGLGTEATEVKLGCETRDRGTASHEIGHLIGLGHTNQRHDRDDFVDYDHARCAAGYVAGNPKGCDTPSRIRAEKRICSDPQVVPNTPVTPAYTTPGDYDRTNDVHVTACAKALCGEMWQFQYDMMAQVEFPIAGEKSIPVAIVPYDYGSIMHYPLDAICMTGKVADGVKQPKFDALNPAHKPGYLGGPTEGDYQTVRAVYGCYKIKAKVDGQADLDVWVNGGWTVLTLKHAAAKRWPALTATQEDKVKFLGMEATMIDPRTNVAVVITDAVKLGVKVPATTVVTFKPDGTTRAEDEQRRQDAIRRAAIEEENRRKQEREAADKIVSDALWYAIQNKVGVFYVWIELDVSMADSLGGADNLRYVSVWVKDGMTGKDIKDGIAKYFANIQGAAQAITAAKLWLPEPLRLGFNAQSYVLLPGHVIGTTVGTAKVKEGVVLKLSK